MSEQKLSTASGNAHEQRYIHSWYWEGCSDYRLNTRHSAFPHRLAKGTKSDSFPSTAFIGITLKGP